MTDDTLDLIGRRPPGDPSRSTTLTIRLGARTAGWVRDVAADESTTPSTVVRRLVEQAEAGSRWPSDVLDWLVIQAAQVGAPGDPDAALIAVVRHLAPRWPQGCRLEGPSS